ncbi:MAG: hypothetical protein ABJP45_03460 [Cyclobacteriaceae bacterium]
MSEQELSKDESLELISDMISQAKRNLARGGSFYFLLWGWVVMLANLGHYLIDKYDLSPYPYFVWILTIPAAIASMVYGAKRGKNAKVKGYLDRVYGLVWLGVMVSVLIILFFMGQVNYNTNAIILTFAGLGTFISGCMLRFSPLIMGGVALWVASVVAFNLAPVDQYLVGAVGILAGYLVPGYLLKKVESEQV